MKSALASTFAAFAFAGNDKSAKCDIPIEFNNYDRIMGGIQFQRNKNDDVSANIGFFMVKTNYRYTLLMTPKEDSN